MQANHCLLFIVGLLLFCLAVPPAHAQVNTAVVVQNSEGLPVADAQVTFSVDGSLPDIAAPLGNGVFEIPAAAAKAVITIEHPSIGSQTLELDLPASQGGLVLLRVDAETGLFKILPFDGVRNLTLVAEQGAPVPPPPGQGCQLPDQLGHGSGGYVAVVSDRTSPFLASDCFVPSQNDQLTHAVWWGAYVNIVFGLGTDCGPGPGDDFQITYYTDNGSGCPGPVLAGPFSVGLTQKFQTGNLLMGFADEWQFQSTFHAPVAVTAGVPYWIQITNNTVGDDDCFWLWSTAPAGDDHSCQTDLSSTPQVRDYDLAFCINFLIEPDGCGTPGPPPNDDCDNCEMIAGEWIFTFDNSFATGGAGGNLLTVCETDFDHSVWYCWTSPCDGLVVLETCNLTDVDTKVSVYSSTTCPPNLSGSLGCNDDACDFQSQLTWNAVSGTTYLIEIGTFPGMPGGPGMFSITCAGTLGNDDCADAQSVGVPSTTPGTTIGSSSDSAPTCFTSNTAPGVWYKVVGTGNTMTASLCNGVATYDSKLTVYCGDCTNLVCVIGNDDACGGQSEVSWCSSVGTEYLILVHGFSLSIGTFELEISDDGTPCGGPVDCSVPLTTNVDVGASIPGLFVRMEPMDLYSRTAGLAPFSRAYDLFTPVTITAPETWGSAELLGWILDDERAVRTLDGTLSGILMGPRKVKAIYIDSAEPTGDTLHRR